jgi:hypothetical protein
MREKKGTKIRLKCGGLDAMLLAWNAPEIRIK